MNWVAGIGEKMLAAILRWLSSDSDSFHFMEVRGQGACPRIHLIMMPYLSFKRIKAHLICMSLNCVFGRSRQKSPLPSWCAGLMVAVSLQLAFTATVLPTAKLSHSLTPVTSGTTLAVLVRKLVTLASLLALLRTLPAMRCFVPGLWNMLRATADGTKTRMLSVTHCVLSDAKSLMLQFLLDKQAGALLIMGRSHAAVPFWNFQLLLCAYTAGANHSRKLCGRWRPKTAFGSTCSKLHSLWL